MTKDEIRARVRQARRRLTSEWIAARSRDIARQAIALPDFAAAQVVGAYLALRDEVQTELILDAAQRQGKTLCVPARRREAGGGYALAHYAADTAVRRGPGGVWEPSDPRWIDMDRVDFIVVPGVAFDRRGGRIGYGRGHMDRLLGCAVPRTFTSVGLAFDFQIFEQVPMENHDVRLDAVISEKDRGDAMGSLHEQKGGTG